jgi:hypothetical protein
VFGGERVNGKVCHLLSPAEKGLQDYTASAAEATVLSQYSNSKSEISDTAKKHGFAVFSNRPRIFTPLLLLESRSGGAGIIWFIHYAN